MSGKRSIKASQIVKDLRSGLSDHELMEKYRLSVRGLQSTFKKLEKAKAVKRSELYGRLAAFADTVSFETMRKVPRNFLTLALRIHDEADPKNVGELLDVTETGVGARGLQFQPGETARLVIVSSGFVELEDIAFDAICRWKREEEDDTWASGFEITNILDSDLKNLRKLINGLAL